jgi:hypothetical protein
MPIWKNGQIDALSLPNGTFLSNDLTRKHMQIVRDNSVYREALERAAKMANYIPPVLTMAKSANKRRADLDALINQNLKAEKSLERKRTNEKGSIISPNAQ